GRMELLERDAVGDLEDPPFGKATPPEVLDGGLGEERDDVAALEEREAKRALAEGVLGRRRELRQHGLAQELGGQHGESAEPAQVVRVYHVVVAAPPHPPQEGGA